MQGSIIALDVSKGNCHYQGFSNLEEPMTKPRILKHTLDGFNQLIEYQARLADKCETEVVFVFEATGVYHRSLQKFLDDRAITYYIVSPLQAAKFRQTQIHANKTDALDCKNIARVYYGTKLRHHRNEAEEYRRMRELNRYYEDILVHLRKHKVSFKAKLDIVFPNLDQYFKSTSMYTNAVLELLKLYPHPKMILGKTSNSVLTKLSKKASSHRKIYLNKIVEKFVDCASTTYSGCNPEDVDVEIIVRLIESIQSCNQEAEEILGKLVELAQKTPNYKSILSIVGVGENLAARIVSELGDIERFDNRNQLISYAGLDPMIRQSGAQSGDHLRISKKGNKRLRCLLYLAATCNYRLKKNDRLYEFNQKKRQQSNRLNSKAANIATAHKLLNIIYGLAHNGMMYSF